MDVSVQTPEMEGRAGTMCKEKEDDYLDSAAETVRLAQHACSSSDKSRLLRLAEGRVDLAEKAHNSDRRRQPVILHPLVAKKMGRRD
jgi:hypothetical protein